MNKLRAKRPEFESVFTDPEEFKEMYKHTFTYAKNRDQKCMEVEVKRLQNQGYDRPYCNPIILSDMWSAMDDVVS